MYLLGTKLVYSVLGSSFPCRKIYQRNHSHNIFQLSNSYKRLMQFCCCMSLVGRLVVVRLLCQPLIGKNFQLDILQLVLRLILLGNSIHLRIFRKELRFQPPHNRNQERS